MNWKKPDSTCGTLLTKNNDGHSTITVNVELHKVDGLVELTNFQPGTNPSASFDMAPAFGGLLTSASRNFVKDGSRSILIEDEITISDSTEMITWQLMTQAEVETTAGGLILKQDGKQLRVSNLTHPDMQAVVVELDPPPLELDRKIEHLKRIEYRYPADMFANGKGSIQVRLAGD